MASTTAPVTVPVAVQGVSEFPAQSVPPEHEFYETAYQRAYSEGTLAPWSLGAPHTALISWLNVEAFSMVRPGCRVVVIGCGLGDDAIELIHRGFDVTAFDCSSTAIEWAKSRFPQESSRFCVGDVCSPPSHWRHRFDLVIDINTLSGVSPERWEAIATGAVDLIHPNGVILTICLGRAANDPIEPRTGPPWPLTSGELTHLLADRGLTSTRALDDFTDESASPAQCLRGAFARNI